MVGLETGRKLSYVAQGNYSICSRNKIGVTRVPWQKLLLVLLEAEGLRFYADNMV